MNGNVGGQTQVCGGIDSHLATGHKVTQHHGMAWHVVIFTFITEIRINNNNNNITYINFLIRIFISSPKKFKNSL